MWAGCWYETKRDGRSYVSQPVYRDTATGALEPSGDLGAPGIAHLLRIKAGNELLEVHGQRRVLRLTGGRSPRRRRRMCTIAGDMSFDATCRALMRSVGL